MFDLLLTEGAAPFTFALILFAGLLALELIMLMVGGTLMGGEVDAPELDVDAPALDIADLDIDFDGIDMTEFDVELDLGDEVAVAADGGGFADWLGFGRMPALLWLAMILVTFGFSGLALQSTLQEVAGFSLPAWIAALPAGAFALWITKRFGRAFARILPQVHSEAVSERHLGRRRGIVSQGTASRGRPAEIRVTDRFGNTQYLRAEPLRDDQTIPQGAEVLILRHQRDDGYRIVPLPTE